ncbi:MAG: Uncharacterized protein CEO40_99 [Parcubacteria group bacterium LiPW_72]|nr:MAG: Uncharacterized protein CEO40_99 [Parcubacteria group bacterium LiPW_72]
MSSWLSKIATLLPPLTMLIGLEFVVQYPEIFWKIFGVIIGCVFFASLYLGRFLSQKKLKQLVYLILPLFYTLSILALFVLAQKSYVQHFFIIGVSLILGIVLNNIATLSKYRFYSHKEVILKSEEDKRKMIVCTTNEALVLLTTFFITANLFGLIYLLSFPLWQALLIIVLVVFSLAYQFLCEIFTPSLAALYTLITSLTASQIFWSLTFWPTNYIANAVIVIVSIYIILGILEYYSRQMLTRRLIKIYFLLGIITISSVLLTNQWVPR